MMVVTDDGFIGCAVGGSLILTKSGMALIAPTTFNSNAENQPTGIPIPSGPVGPTVSGASLNIILNGGIAPGILLVDITTTVMNRLLLFEIHNWKHLWMQVIDELILSYSLNLSSFVVGNLFSFQSGVGPSQLKYSNTVWLP